MLETIRSLAREHRSFYEVSPYYIMLEERHEGLDPVTRRIQAGFDVDVYGVNLNGHLTMPGPDPDYALAREELRKLSGETASHAADQCAIEVISFPSTAILDVRTNAVEARLRIRIHHYRGLSCPAGTAEERALEELEQELKSMGINRR